MKLVAFTQTFLFLLFLFTSGTLSLPTPEPIDLQDTSANLALDARSQLEKRDSWDCKGSGVCGIHINPESCLQALSKINPDVTYRSSFRQFHDNGGPRLGSCFVEYACGKQKDYISAAEYGVSKGWSLRESTANFVDVGAGVFIVWVAVKNADRSGSGEHAGSHSTIVITRVVEGHKWVN
ncbi:hypothetical protein TWF718_009861 [Orbilia javanica]|uniref:Peptidase C1A papain C-terminal domain-containing protein n=1 Tax=Orbilia javanica TaxID=47235 RepID=A0AAN8RFC2_9PEZI